MGWWINQLDMNGEIFSDKVENAKSPTDEGPTDFG